MAFKKLKILTVESKSDAAGNAMEEQFIHNFYNSKLDSYQNMPSNFKNIKKYNKCKESVKVLN